MIVIKKKKGEMTCEGCWPIREGKDKITHVNESQKKKGKLKTLDGFVHRSVYLSFRE